MNLSSRTTKLLAGIILTLAVCLTGAYAIIQNLRTHDSPPPRLEAGSSASIGVPITLSIPKLSITAPIRAVGKDVQGNMIAPKKLEETTWYEPGTRPGTEGTAVIAGHLDNAKGKPGIFYDLEDLEPGDAVYVTDAAGVMLRFDVTEKIKFSSKNAPLDRIFGSTSGKHLNLITCAGRWDQTTKTYTDRLVVFTQLHEEKSSDRGRTALGF